jgi:hypothetical protein
LLQRVHPVSELVKDERGNLDEENSRSGTRTGSSCLSVVKVPLIGPLGSTGSHLSEIKSLCFEFCVEQCVSDVPWFQKSELVPGFSKIMYPILRLQLRQNSS